MKTDMSINLEMVKKLLEKEERIPSGYDGDYGEPTSQFLEVAMMPILHNEDRVFLQFNGWAINLFSNGTWDWEDTTGG